MCEGVQCMCCEDKETECVREFSVCVVKIVCEGVQCMCCEDSV